MIDLLDKDIQYLLKQENPSASGKKKSCWKEEDNKYCIYLDTV